MTNGPIASEAEALPQPQHRFEPSYRWASDMDGLKAADLGLLHREMVAFDPLLQVLGDAMHAVEVKQPIANR